MDAKKKRVSEAELHAFCDDELGQEDAARVARALEDDPELRREMAAIMRDRSLIEAAARTADPEGEDIATRELAARLSAAIDRKAARRDAMRIGTGAIGVMGVAAAGWFGHAHFERKTTGIGEFVASAPLTAPATFASAGVPSFVADAAGAHAVFAPDLVHPVEFTAHDEELMRDWFASHLGSQAMVPHLEELGFALMGGRLLGNADGAMAQLIYENERGDKVSLVFGKRPVPGGSELRLVQLGKSYASYWQDRGFAWAVVEDSPGADVSAVAAHVSKLTRELSR
jgi:anti-sigma factor RsiW